VEDCARKYDLPLRVMVAMPGAESGLSPFAERWGGRTDEAKALLDAVQAGDEGARAILEQIIRQAGYDVSFGFTQLIAATAGGYGIGDGSYSVENLLAIRTLLFDRAASIDLGARHLRSACDAVLDWKGDYTDLEALAYYNAGGYSFEASYWNDAATAANVANYRSWLEFADRILAEQGLA